MCIFANNLATKAVKEDYSVKTLPTVYACRKNLPHPVRDVSSQIVKRPFIVNTKMEPSRTDQSFNRPMVDVIKEFELAGKTLADIRSARYDFEDGKDTGISVGIARRRNVEFEDVASYQKQVDSSLAENLANDVNTALKKKDSDAKSDAKSDVKSDSSNKGNDEVTA